MSDALVVDGNKVMVQLMWEQVDAIIEKELREHIIMLQREREAGLWVHPDDQADNEELFPALCKVHKYWAGEAESMRLMDELGIGYEKEESHE